MVNEEDLEKERTYGMASVHVSSTCVRNWNFTRVCACMCTIGGRLLPSPHSCFDNCGGFSPMNHSITPAHITPPTTTSGARAGGPGRGRGRLGSGRGGRGGRGERGGGRFGVRGDRGRGRGDFGGRGRGGGPGRG